MRDEVDAVKAKRKRMATELPISTIAAIRIWSEIMSWLVQKGRFTDCAMMQVTMHAAAAGQELGLNELEALERIADDFRAYKEGKEV